MKDVVLGFDSILGYTSVDNNFGATIGRYGNRIANGKITVAGVEYQLPKNNYGHTLHGGPNGFDKKVFKANQPDSQTVVLTCVSPDGEAGFPGNLNVKVTMKLTQDNAIDISYEAETDKETVVNLTNHSYFNLSSDPNNTIQRIVNYHARLIRLSIYVYATKDSKSDGSNGFRTPTPTVHAKTNDRFRTAENGKV
jgi:aldose 1-epimerase